MSDEPDDIIEPEPPDPDQSAAGASAAAVDELPAERPRMELAQLEAIVEALVYASPEPLTAKVLVKLLSDEPKEDVQAAIDALIARYDRPGGPRPATRRCAAS